MVTARLKSCPDGRPISSHGFETADWLEREATSGEKGLAPTNLGRATLRQGVPAFENKGRRTYLVDSAAQIATSPARKKSASNSTMGVFYAAQQGKYF